MAERKVLFLDIDGVINCSSTAQRFQETTGIDPAMATLVNKIQLETGCEVVLSSTWRIAEASKQEILRHIQFSDVTPFHSDDLRGEEIARWLAQNLDVTRYAILDDDDDFLAGQPVFNTEWRFGLTEEIAQAVIAHLRDP